MHPKGPISDEAHPPAAPERRSPTRHGWSFFNKPADAVIGAAALLGPEFQVGNRTRAG